jgi:hypothetical protein
MIGITRRLFISFCEIAFQGEKDVTSLPVPVKTVDVWIQGVIRWKLRNVGVVGLFVGPKIKADGSISGGRNIPQDKLETVLLGVTPSVLI